MALIFSCSDSSQGKFKNTDSTGTTKLDTNLKFLKEPPVTKWDPSWSTDNVLVYHWKSAPSGLHPTNDLSLSSTRVIMEYTQRFMIGPDMENLVVRPDLCKTLPSPSADLLTWTYELRDEPMWDDGTQLSVDDVIFTLKAWECPLTNNEYAKSSIDNLKDVKQDPSNPRKFILTMKGPYVQNEDFMLDIPMMEKKIMDPGNVLAKYSLDQFYNPAFVNEKHVDLDSWAKEFNDQKYGRQLDLINGLGAYKVTAWDDMQGIVLSRKTNHWTSKLVKPDMYNVSYPEKIIFKVNLDDAAIGQELLQQTIDASSWVSTLGLAELQKDSSFNKNYYSAFVQNFDYEFLGMNEKPEAVNRPPFFTDIRVRKAIALVTPVEELNKNYFIGKGFRMTSMVSPIKRDVFDKTLPLIQYNLDSAKKLLDEAGWKDTDGDNIRDKMIDGKKVQFVCECLIATGPVYQQIANDIAAAMYPAGIKVTARAQELPVLQQTVTAHQFDLYLGAWQSTFLPEDYKQIWHTSSYSNGGSNFCGFGNAASDALIDSIRVTLDASKRIPMEKRLQKIIYDDQPYVFMFSTLRKVVVHRRFDHGDIYFEKPGLYLSNLRAMAPGKLSEMTTIN